tara:strand:- start:306 stop:497 length:192 start_codon:yes stop_codon:yes gene_type:complete
MVKKDTKKVTVKQIKSLIGKTSKQKSSIKGLGLKRINHKVVLDNTPEVQGMIKVVKHMIEVEN